MTANYCPHDNRREEYSSRNGRPIIAFHCDDCGRLIGEIETMRVACDRCGKPLNLSSGACYDCGATK